MDLVAGWGPGFVAAGNLGEALYGLSIMALGIAAFTSRLWVLGEMRRFDSRTNVFRDWNVGFLEARYWRMRKEVGAPRLGWMFIWHWIDTFAFVAGLLHAAKEFSP